MSRQQDLFLIHLVSSIFSSVIYYRWLWAFGKKYLWMIMGHDASQLHAARLQICLTIITFLAVVWQLFMACILNWFFKKLVWNFGVRHRNWIFKGKMDHFRNKYFLFFTLISPEHGLGFSCSISFNESIFHFIKRSYEITDRFNRWLSFSCYSTNIYCRRKT